VLLPPKRPEPGAPTAASAPVTKPTPQPPVPAEQAPTKAPTARPPAPASLDDLFGGGPPNEGRVRIGRAKKKDAAPEAPTPASDQSSKT
jgi:hypothetical protein